MSIPSFYTYQSTGENLEEYTSREDRTTSPKIPEKNEEKNTALPLLVENKTETETSHEEKPIMKIYFGTNFSNEYVSFNTSSLIEKIDSELSSWENLETEEALAHISNIKDLLEVSVEYLTQKPETRILLSILELLFQNNNWENMNKGDIIYLRSELKRFSEGEVDWDNLTKFSKQLYRKRMHLLKVNNKNGKKQQTTKN